jgi:hypothetical protein
VREQSPPLYNIYLQNEGDLFMHRADLARTHRLASASYYSFFIPPQSSERSESFAETRKQTALLPRGMRRALRY